MKIKTILCGLVGACWLPLAAAKPIVVSTQPLALLAAAVVPGDTIGVLLPPDHDAHHPTLVPSQIQLLEQAELVFWLGPLAEPALARAVARLPPQRAHAVGPQAAELAAQHPWLNPDYAQAMVQALAQSLVMQGSVTPELAAQRLQQFNQSLADVAQTYKAKFAGLSDTGYLALHQAYASLADYYGLHSLGAVVDAAGNKPSARRLWQIEQQLQARSATCVLVQPQVPQRYLAAFAGQNLQLVNADPLAAGEMLATAGFVDYYQRLLAAIYACMANQQASAPN